MNTNKDEEAAHGKRELLVIITGDRADESFKQVSANFNVKQAASNRVAVVEGDQSVSAQLKTIPSVTVVPAGDIPSALAEKLDEGESLFVSAWVSRTKEGTSKKRPGEGLSWDAPGFEPPDPPPGS